MLCCSSAQSISASMQAGAAASRVGDGSREQRWVPWLSRTICSQGGRLMALLTVTCNPGKNRRHNSLPCLGSAGMQQAPRARDGRVLILSCPTLENIKTAGRKRCREKRGWKKPNRESNTVEFHSVMTSFSLITTDTPPFSLIYLLFHSSSQQINN